MHVRSFSRHASTTYISRKYLRRSVGLGTEVGAAKTDPTSLVVGSRLRRCSHASRVLWVRQTVCREWRHLILTLSTLASGTMPHVDGKPGPPFFCLKLAENASETRYQRQRDSCLVVHGSAAGLVPPRLPPTVPRGPLGAPAPALRSRLPPATSSATGVPKIAA